MVAFYLQHWSAAESNPIKGEFFLRELKFFEFAGNELDE